MPRKRGFCLLAKTPLHLARVPLECGKNLCDSKWSPRFWVTWLRLRHFFILEDKHMPDSEKLYQALYHMMVNAVEEALAALENGNVWDARRILIEVEQRAEELYLSATE